MLKGKCAVVTGATRGIGRAIAIRLASLGADIVVNYRSSIEEANTLKEELSALGAKVLLVKADVSIEEEAKNLIAKTLLQICLQVCVIVEFAVARCVIRNGRMELGRFIVAHGIRICTIFRTLTTIAITL